MQESFTDTIAFNQLFSGEIAGVIMEFFKKFKRRAGGQPIRHKGEIKLYVQEMLWKIIFKMHLL